MFLFNKNVICVTALRQYCQRKVYTTYYMSNIVLKMAAPTTTTTKQKNVQLSNFIAGNITTNVDVQYYYLL